MHSIVLAVLLAISTSLASSPMDANGQVPNHSAQSGKARLGAILDYISQSWGALTRSTTTCEGIADNKVVERPLLYLPADFAVPAGLAGRAQDCGFDVKKLPFVLHKLGEVRAKEIQPPGLLYLEYPYVVPGGRFNEMYGWDSYFIIRGLLRSGKIELARGMVENFFFEIEHYGAVLNANRTYYLTRSQPPFLSSMIMAVYEAEKAHGQADQDWLAKAYRYTVRDYEMWTREPHLAGGTGLSRYYDTGDGPVPEGLHDEVDYYHDVLAYLVREHRGSAYLAEADTADSLPHPEYSTEVCEDHGSSAGNKKCNVKRHASLSSEYYKGDRSMRESGFDITFRFGPYGAGTDRYAPVCLNSLLYKTETDLETMSVWLENKQAAEQWHERAEKRKTIMRTLLWDQNQGMFFDYNFEAHKLSSYEYATTFYPLWVGLASTEQAREVARSLSRFEQKGGLAMSTKETGVQWDFPYGWAPIQLLAVEGLRRYGYKEAADRISYKFLSMVLDNFERDGNIREKYNVVTDLSNIQVAEGYRGNIIGFGWTNAVFLELLSALSQDSVKRLERGPLAHSSQP
jgi:alpha,alpha-trehalase